jgi:hypothetical protein
MKALVTRVAEAAPLAIEEVDVSTDAALEARYGHEVPVLEIEGRTVAKYRIAEGRLRALVKAIVDSR